MSVWRWHITMATSILHRVSGCALYAAALLGTAWALSLASGPDAYDLFKLILGSFPGKIVMFLFSLAVFYHLAKGVQHLVWDTGRGLDIKSANAGAVATIAFTIIATLATWALAGAMGAL